MWKYRETYLKLNKVSLNKLPIWSILNTGDTLTTGNIGVCGGNFWDILEILKRIEQFEYLQRKDELFIFASQM